jgi:hypothetical protein
VVVEKNFKIMGRFFLTTTITGDQNRCQKSSCVCKIQGRELHGGTYKKNKIELSKAQALDLNYDDIYFFGSAINSL